MRIILLVGSGSFIGGILRYFSSLYIQQKLPQTFPFATLGVNIVGCFLIGILFALTERSNISLEARLFFATGICGGFTTFSAFSQETFYLLRSGQFAYATIYVMASILVGLIATFAGFSALKFFNA